jgi:hypothetical protein
MFVKAHKNVERFHVFINEELDDRRLLNFYRFETSFQMEPKNPASLSRQTYLSYAGIYLNERACKCFPGIVVSDHISLHYESPNQSSTPCMVFSLIHKPEARTINSLTGLIDNNQQRN